MIQHTDVFFNTVYQFRYSYNIETRTCYRLTVKDEYTVKNFFIFILLLLVGSFLKYWDTLSKQEETLTHPINRLA